jgi:hypothetical protein
MRSKFTRRICAWTTLAALLSMQLAVAVHACPSLIRSDAGMAPGCMGSMDLDQTSLCQAHDDAQHQLGEHASSLPSPTAVAIAVALLPAPLCVLGSSAQSRLDSYYLSRLAQDGSPPIFLRLQVLRT